MVNVWASSQATGEGTADGSGAAKYTATASVAVMNYDNTSKVIIREGVEINQRTDAPFTDRSNQEVEIAANLSMTMINVAGIIAIQADRTNVVKSLKAGKPGDIFTPIGNKAGVAGLGGSVLVQAIDNTVEAIVESDVRVNTGASNKLSLTATQDVFSFEFAQSGGEAGKFGLSGSVSVMDGENRTIAYIHDGATITGGGVDVSADDSTHHIAMVGAIQLGKGAGVGVSIGIQTIDRDTQAILGNQRFELNSSAVSTGANTISIPGSFASGDRVLYEAVGTASIGGLTSGNHYFAIPQGDGSIKLASSKANAIAGTQINLTSASGSYRFETAAKTAVSVGSGNVNTSNDRVTMTAHGLQSGDALHYNAGSTTIGGLTDLTTYFVHRVDANTIELRATPDAATSIGLSSAGAGTHLFERVLSIFDGGTSGVSIAATSTGKLWTLGIAGAVISKGKKGNTSTTGVSAPETDTPTQSGVGIAGDATWNEIDNTVKAYINSDGWMQTAATADIAATATDSTSIISISGAIAVVATGKNTIGIAGSFSRNLLDLDTEAFINGVRITRANDVTAIATRDGSLFALSAAVAATKASSAAPNNGIGLALAGSFSWNTIDGKTTSRIEDIDVSDAADVKSLANDSSNLLAIGGGVGVTFSGQLGFGAGVGVNQVDGGAYAYLVDSKIRVTGNVEAKAENSASIHGIGFSVGAGIIGIAGTVGINEMDTDAVAIISGGDISARTASGSTAGSIQAIATDNAKIRADAGALAIGIKTKKQSSVAPPGAGALGVAVTINDIDGETKAKIENALIDTDGAVKVESKSNSKIEALSLAGAVAVVTPGSGSSVGIAVGASIALNEIDRVNSASITGSTTNVVGDTVNVQAIDQSLIQSYVIGAAVSVAVSSSTSGSVSIGLSIAENIIGNQVTASVDGATISASGNVNVSARSEQEDLFTLPTTGANQITAAELDDAATTESDDSKTSPANENLVDVAADALLIAKLRASFTGGNSLSGEVDLTQLNPGNEWLLVDEISAVTYTIVKRANGDLVVQRNNIETVSAAASVAVAAGSGNSVGFSGAGAYSKNTITSKTSATVNNATITTSVADSDVAVTANSASGIVATVISAAVGVAVGGGSVGGAAAMGISLAFNSITPASGHNEVALASVTASTITAADDLLINATTAQSISSVVIAVSVAVGVTAGSAGLGRGRETG